jgi:hypothetical protein
VDFASMLRPIDFARKPGKATDVPRPLLRSRAKDRSRRLAALKEAADVLAVLPENEGDELHGWMTGRYDLADLFEVVIDRLGPVDLMQNVTLAFSAKNGRTMLEWIDRRLVARLSFLASSFWFRHNKGIFREVQDGFAKADPERFRLVHSRYHAKVTCMTFASRAKLAVETSANWRTNSNVEQLSIFRDAELCDYHGRVIDAEVNRAAASGNES